MRLIDAEPTLYREIGKDEWMFQYGAGLVGQQCGAAYFNSQNPRYVRYNVNEQDGRPVFEQVSERALTAEELHHFSRLVKQLQPPSPMIDREHGRFI